MFLRAIMHHHCLYYDLVLFPTLLGTDMISDSSRQYQPFSGPFLRPIASAKGTKGNPRGSYCLSMRSCHRHSSVGPTSSPAATAATAQHALEPAAYPSHAWTWGDPRT